MAPAKRGRPSVSADDTPPARIHLTLPSRQYDALEHEAQRRDNISVPELIRRKLAAADGDEDLADD